VFKKKLKQQAANGVESKPRKNGLGYSLMEVKSVGTANRKSKPNRRKNKEARWEVTKKRRKRATRGTLNPVEVKWCKNWGKKRGVCGKRASGGGKTKKTTTVGVREGERSFALYPRMAKRDL